ncbi:MAG: hypothetical protein GX418_05795 [Clostridiales bacterium]|nr:hypothetical protein [Clostridiales bacterium]
MNRLDNLPEIARRELGGLNADARLLAKIRLAAAGPAAPRRARLRPVLTAGLAFALCLCVGLWAVPALMRDGAPAGQGAGAILDTHAAGQAITPVTGAQLRALDVPSGVISVGGSAADAGSYRNLFAPERDGNFPLILADGAAYRMLISPTNMNAKLLGETLGTVTEYTLEPALSSGGVVSNIVSAGETVYAVKGMRGALAAAYVKGSLRVFQRVSFAGTALLGRETLADTLASADHITAMELTGAGVVDSVQAAQGLMQTLFDNAEYESASVGSGSTRSLLIGLDNGLLMQLMVGEDTLSACGTWSCPGFLEAYAQAMEGEAAP